MLPLLFLVGCLERVTGVAVPLDPRFYENAAGADAPAALRPTLGRPWDGYPGDTQPVSVLVTAPEADVVQVDFWLANPDTPGGQERIGTVEAAAGETLSLSVPVEVLSFRIEGFQDPDSDGPSEADPWGSADVKPAALAGTVALTLVPGGRGTSGTKQSEAPWFGIDSTRTRFTGRITSELENGVQVDVTEKDAAVEGGQRRVGAVRLPEPGEFSIEVPDTVAEFKLEAFQDLTGDGPSIDDAYAEAIVTREAFGGGVSIALVVGARSMPKTEGSNASGGDGNEVPWATTGGQTVDFMATLRTPSDASVQVDVSEPDPAAPGGQRLVGKMRLNPVSGVLTIPLAVPVSVASFKLEGFQDKTGDGPSNDDPYGEALVSTSGSAGTLDLTLVEGARGRAGGPGGGQSGPDLGSGPKVRVGGAITHTGTGVVAVDIFKIDPTTKAGRSMVIKVEAAQGRWETRLPVDFGSIAITAYQDTNENGYGMDDPQRNYAPSPVPIGSSDVVNLDVALP